jgi:hypothetical protein
MKSIIISMTILFSFQVFPKSAYVEKSLNKYNSKISLKYLKKPARHTKEFSLKKKIFQLAKKKFNMLQFLDFKKWYAANFFFGMKKMVDWNLKGSYNKMKPFKGYNKQGDRPLEGYLTAKNWSESFSVLKLKNIDLRRTQMVLLSKKSIKSHKLMVLAQDKAWRRNSENIEDFQLGLERYKAVGWNQGFIKKGYNRVVRHKSRFKNQVWTKAVNPL